MSRQLPITDDDIQNAVRLLGEVAGMTEPLAVRRRYFVDGVASLINADFWCWSISRFDERRFPGVILILDNITDDEERGRFYTPCCDAALSDAIHYSFDFARHTSFLLGTHLPGFASSAGSQLIERLQHASGTCGTVFSAYPLSTDVMSLTGFNRRTGGLPYDERERVLVQLLMGQVDWLHREGIFETPVNGPSVLGLTPRQLEVLIHMLAGDATKQIARKMRISEHTAKDHAKALHRHFNVDSRSALLSKFISVN